MWTSLGKEPRCAGWVWRRETWRQGHPRKDGQTEVTVDREAGNLKPGVWTSTGHRASNRPKSALRVEGVFSFLVLTFRT